MRKGSKLGRCKIAGSSPLPFIIAWITFGRHEARLRFTRTWLGIPFSSAPELERIVLTSQRRERLQMPCILREGSLAQILDAKLGDLLG